MTGKLTYENLEQRIREQEKETILNSLIEHVIYQDPKMRIRWANRAACESANMTFEEILGRYCYEIWPKRSAPCPDCPVMKAMATCQPQKIGKSTPDGRSWFIRGYPVRDEEGHVVGGIEVTMEITKYKKAEEALRESEGKLNAMLQSIADHMSMMDKDLNIIWANEIAKRIFGNDIVGKKCYEVYHKRKKPCEPSPCITLKSFQDGKVHKHETEVIDREGETINFHCTANVAWRDEEGKPTAVIEISRDITTNKQIERALNKAHKELEHRVHERTRELEIKTKSLEELNTAMEVLLKKRKEDKTELEDNVLTNVKELIAPYIDKIKATKLDEQQKALLSIIESNMNEIISPFTRKLSLTYLKLTPTEIKIANMIKHGYTTKKIANILNISPRTVDTHRKNIREKIGLDTKRANLRSHLLTLH